LGRLVDLAAQNSLSGLEFAAGIPGTIGGAIRGNAGAWQEDIGGLVSRVKVLGEAGKIFWINRADCRFSYRQSRFKKSKEIILEVELKLVAGDKDKIKAKINENLTKRLCQPSEPSAGCVFKNPKPQSAGAFIDQCGLKGKIIGGAQISPKHANFIVNLGHARAMDVLELMELARGEVKKKFGLTLENEICLLGFDTIKKHG
jgi:UDP-N-acetylmuramate dehydrogenase